MGRDFYGILGVSKNASPKQLKSAYRKLAVQWHPDKNKDPEAEGKFKDISYAYSVLSDPEKKKIYDQFGEEGLQGSSGAGPSGGIPIDPRVIFQTVFGGQQGGMGDIFNMFGGMGGMGGHGIPINMGGHSHQRRQQAPPQPSKPADDVHTLNLTLEQLYKGFKRKLSISRNRNGVSEKSEIDLNVLAGMRTGQKLRFHQAGNANPGQTPADIVFAIKEKPHPFFKREKHNLVYKAQIPLKDALLGPKFKIQHVDGNSFEVSIPKVVHPSYVHTIIGKGMPVPGKRDTFGNMYIKFDIIFPKHISDQQKQIVSQFL